MVDEGVGIIRCDKKKSKGEVGGEGIFFLFFWEVKTWFVLGVDTPSRDELHYTLFFCFVLFCFETPGFYSLLCSPEPFPLRERQKKKKNIAKMKRCKHCTHNTFQKRKRKRKRRK